MSKRTFNEFSIPTATSRYNYAPGNKRLRVDNRPLPAQWPRDFGLPVFDAYGEITDGVYSFDLAAVILNGEDLSSVEYEVENIADLIEGNMEMDMSSPSPASSMGGPVGVHGLPQTPSMYAGIHGLPQTPPPQNPQLFIFDEEIPELDLGPPLIPIPLPTPPRFPEYFDSPPPQTNSEWSPEIRCEPSLSSTLDSIPWGPSLNSSPYPYSPPFLSPSPSPCPSPPQPTQLPQLPQPPLPSLFQLPLFAHCPVGRMSAFNNVRSMSIDLQNNKYWVQDENEEDWEIDMGDVDGFVRVQEGGWLLFYRFAREGEEESEEEEEGELQEEQMEEEDEDAMYASEHDTESNLEWAEWAVESIAEYFAQRE